MESLNNVCLFCKHYKVDGMNKEYCNKAGYEHNDYGMHHRGAYCVHDRSLKNHFEPAKESETSNDVLKERLFEVEKQLGKELEANRELRRRLTLINEGGEV